MVLEWSWTLDPSSFSFHGPALCLALHCFLQEVLVLRKTEPWMTSHTQIAGCRLHVCVPPNSYVYILTPKIMVLQGRTFRRWLGHEVRAFKVGISVFIKEVYENFLVPSTCEDSERRSSLCGMAIIRYQIPDLLASWPWTFQSPELWEIDFCCLIAT
jgi:hypothetical protein